MTFPQPIIQLILDYCAEYVVWPELGEPYWEELRANPHPGAMAMVSQSSVELSWGLSRNPNPEAIALLKTNPGKINWKWLSRNPHPWAIEQLRANLHKVDKFQLLLNPGAIDILIEHPEFKCGGSIWGNPAAIGTIIDAGFYAGDVKKWGYFSANSHPIAMELLRDTPLKIDWDWLCENHHPAAARMLRNNIKVIIKPEMWSSRWIWRNPGIFELRDQSCLRASLSMLVW